jgi:protein ImuA
MGYDSTYGHVIPLPARGRMAATLPGPAVGRATLQEALAVRVSDVSATAFVLAALPQMQKPILWVQDRASGRENGRLHLGGGWLTGGGMPILQVDVSHPRDVLWAMEEGAACGGLAAVVGEVHGAPSVLDFTATKRLALRSEMSGVPVWLIRWGDPGGLSAARDRWRVAALPSRRHPLDPAAPGSPLWDADLFRARGRPPGRWIASHDPNATQSADRLCLVSASGDGPVAQPCAKGTDIARR